MSGSRPPGFGLRLRSTREQRNLTQEQLAERLGVSVSSINRWEREKSYPRADQRRLLSEILGATSEALFMASERPWSIASRSDGRTDAGREPSSDLGNEPGAAGDGAIQRAHERGKMTLVSAPFAPANDTPFWDVRPARALELGDPLLKQGRRPIEAYFARACFGDVGAAVRRVAQEGRQEGGGVALFGPPMIGKTRMALEALRREAPDFLLVPWPRHDFALAALDDFRARPVALLLDDLHELAYQHEVGRILAAVRRLLAIAERLIVVATSRSGLDEAVTHQHFDGLIESLGLRIVHLAPMARDASEAAGFFAFVREVAAREPARQFRIDAFDGTPGSVLLGLERRTTQLRSPRFPSAAKAILKALALLRATSVYEYPESRVRRVAEQVFELAPSQWPDALDYLVGSGWVSLDEGDLRGESRLHVPSDAYLDICLIESGVYPRSNRPITSDYPKVAEALSRAPVDSEALFALSRTIVGSRAAISKKWNELSLTCALRGLEPLDPTREPELWARGQRILGSAHWRRWAGDPVDNMRHAIAALEAASTILTRESHPVDWAAMQRTLGTVLADEALAADADYLDRGIVHLSQALEILTPELFPYEWGATHVALGDAYARRERGSRSVNLERAIEHFSRAAQTLTRATYPAAWTVVMRNMADTYTALPHGDRAANEARAITCCQEILNSGIESEFQYDWARTHVVLGTIYRDRTRGDREQNLTAAISHYNNALAVFTPAEYGLDREKVLGELARARAALDQIGGAEESASA